MHVENPRWWMDAILKKIFKKSPYLANGLYNRHKIWNNNAYAVGWTGCIILLFPIPLTWLFGEIGINISTVFTLFDLNF